MNYPQINGHGVCKKVIDQNENWYIPMNELGTTGWLISSFHMI